MYNKNNIFYKIIQKEISTSILYENKFFICIKDINPQSAIHFLIISKNNYRYFSDLTNSQEQLSLFDFIQYYKLYIILPVYILNQ